jgi:hypothetical protein
MDSFLHCFVRVYLILTISSLYKNSDAMFQITYRHGITKLLTLAGTRGCTMVRQKPIDCTLYILVMTILYIITFIFSSGMHIQNHNI